MSTLKVDRIKAAGGVGGGTIASNVKLEKITLSGSLDVTGSLTVTGSILAAGVSSSSGMSGSYANFNSLGINDGGTNTIKLLGTGEISGSGELNIVGASTLESTLHVSGAISGAAGITGSSLQINDTIFLNANGKITGVNSLSASSEVFAGTVFVNDAGTNSIKLLGTGEISGSGDLNIVGAATLESTLNVSGATTVASLFKVKGAGIAAGTTCISGAGDLNIVGHGYFQNTLNVTGVINSTAGLTASLGMSASVANFNTLLINAGGANTVKLLGTGEISGSGDLNIVGAATLESTLNVTGVINSAAGMSASLGMSASVANFNKIEINAGGAKQTKMLEGSMSASHEVFAGQILVNDLGTNAVKILGTGKISGSGDLNIVGAATLENTLHVSGAISGAVGLSGSSLIINNSILLNANGNITGVRGLTASADMFCVTGISASLGMSSSVGNFNTLLINEGGTKSVSITGDGKIDAKLGITGSSVSASYAHFNSLTINDTGTNAVELTGDGRLLATDRIETPTIKAGKNADAAGGGFDEVNVRLMGKVIDFNGEFITTFQIDLGNADGTGMRNDGSLKDVIGESGQSNAFFSRILDGVNGFVYKIEMACIEAPAPTALADIDLVANSSDGLAEGAAYDSAGSAVVLIAATANWTAGMHRVSTAGTDFSAIDADFLYLACGNAGSGAEYTAGKFIIKLYGAKF